MKPLSYKRIAAYILDILIVTFLSTVLTYFLPANKEYEENAARYLELFNSYTKEEITKEEFTKETNDVIYVMNYNSVTTTVVNTVLTISYFVVLTYFMNGQTIGKKIMKLKIVSNDQKKLTMNNYLIRSLLINSVLMNIISIISIIGLSKAMYIKVNDITTYLFGILYIVTFGMILFREDRRGLHDYIALTRVIDVSEKAEDVENESIKNKDDKLESLEIIGKKQIKM